MGYYRGDYVPGYYRGSIFGTIGNVLGGAIGGFIKGGPIGAITGAIGGAASATAKNVTQATLAAGGNQTAMTPALRSQHAAALQAHGISPLGTHAKIAPIGGSPAGTPSGNMHLLKAPRGTGAAGAGGGRRRRMNWANTRALSRAERRIGHFMKHVRNYYRMVHPAHGGTLHPNFHPKKRGKKRA